MSSRLPVNRNPGKLSLSRAGRRDRVVHMSTKKQPSNHPNNARLRVLITSRGLTQGAALALFNKGQLRAISESGWKAWLAAPDSVRWRQMDDPYVLHAEKVFGGIGTRTEGDEITGARLQQKK